MASCGDLTAEAAVSGRHPHASISGRIPIKIDGAPALPRRPPRFLGMRPPAIGAGRRIGNPRDYSYANEAAA